MYVVDFKGQVHDCDRWRAWSMIVKRPTLSAAWKAFYHATQKAMEAGRPPQEQDGSGALIGTLEVVYVAE